jgi:hypothetical protein
MPQVKDIVVVEGEAKQKNKFTVLGSQKPDVIKTKLQSCRNFWQLDVWHEGRSRSAAASPCEPISLVSHRFSHQQFQVL